MEDRVSFLITRCAAIGATLLGGIVAGFSLNRMLVELPTWKMLGVSQWAQFAHAELGRGLWIYPLEGLAALALTVAAAVCCYFDASSQRSAALPLYVAALAAVLAFGVTRFLIAPQVLNLPEHSTEYGVMRNALEQTERWWQVKTGLHLLTFVCNLWGVVKVVVN